MSTRLDISKGVDPIPMFSDIRNDEHFFYVDDVRYCFRQFLPFTVIEVPHKNKFGKMVKGYRCADKELILKHKDKAAYVTELARQEVIRG